MLRRLSVRALFGESVNREANASDFERYPASPAPEHVAHALLLLVVGARVVFEHRLPIEDFHGSDPEDHRPKRPGPFSE